MFSFWKKLTRRQQTVLWACYLAFFGNGTFSLMIGSSMPDLKLAYGLTDTVSGVFISAHSIGNLVSGFISGLVPLYLGERKGIILLASLAYIGLIMMIVWGNPVWLFIAFVLTGFGRGSVTSFTNRTVNKLSGGSPSASNLLHGAFAVGAIVSPMFFILGKAAFDWRTGVLTSVLCGSAGLISFGRMQLENDRPDRRDKTQSTISFIRKPAFVISAMMMFCYLCSEYAINGWLVTYVQSKESLTAELALKGGDVAASIRSYSQTMASLMWAVMLAGRLVCATLASKLPQKKMMLALSVGTAAFFTLMLVGSSIAVVTCAVAGLGLCMSGICPMIYSDAAPITNAYPMATSTILAIGSAGSIVMPTIVGSLAERFGFTGGMSAILVTVVLLVVFSFLNVCLNKRHVNVE